MALPVNVYRWDDAGAPQLPNSSNPPSLLFEVLKKCLVEGYGTKQPLGWTLPFSSSNGLNLVFRNDEIDGSGSFVKFWTVNNDDRNNDNVHLCCAPMIISAEEDILENPSRSHLHTISAAFTKWVLIGTKAGFYLMTNRGQDKMTTNPAGNPCIFVGDIDSFFNEDLSRFTICESGITSDESNLSYSHYRALGNVGSEGYLGKMKQTDGGGISRQMILRSPFFAANSKVDGEQNASNTIVFSPLIFVSDSSPTSNSETNFDSNGVVSADSNLQPSCRGRLPGFVQSVYAGYSDQDWPYIKQINSQTYFLLQNHQGNACQNWVNMEEWYV